MRQYRPAIIPTHAAVRLEDQTRHIPLGPEPAYRIKVRSDVIERLTGAILVPNEKAMGELNGLFASRSLELMQRLDPNQIDVALAEQARLGMTLQDFQGKLSIAIDDLAGSILPKFGVPQVRDRSADRENSTVMERVVSKKMWQKLHEELVILAEQHGGAPPKFGRSKSISLKRIIQSTNEALLRVQTPEQFRTVYRIYLDKLRQFTNELGAKAVEFEQGLKVVIDHLDF